MSGLHDFEAEARVIGGLLLDNTRFPDVAARLIPEDFAREELRRVYEAIIRLDAEHHPVDVVTLADAMESAGTLEHVGGLPYLGELAKSTYSAASVGHYARIVREHAVRRRLVQDASELIDRAQRNEDIVTLLDDAQSRMLVLAQERSHSGPQIMASYLPQFLEDLERRFSHDGSVVGVPSGFDELDQMTAGFQPGELIVIAGRPSMGKTSLAMNIAEHVALRIGDPALVFSLEMSADQLTQRMVSSLREVSLTRIRKGEMEDRHWPKITDAVQALKTSPLHIDDSGGLSVMDVRARARRVHRLTPLSLIVIDYLQLMNGNGENQTQIISAISRGLKALAKELSCPVIALSQLNREVDKRSNKRPMMSDLRESGAIEQDADLILFVYRDEMYNKDTEQRGLAELILAKQRNGPIGTVYARFEGHYCRFQNYSGPIPNDEPSGWSGGYAA